MLDPLEIEHVRRRLLEETGVEAELQRRGSYLKSPLRSRLVAKYRQVRMEAYNFLERPANTLAFLYHIVVFSYIICVHCLSAVAEVDQLEGNDAFTGVQSAVHYMELSLAVYFSAEFVLRLWAVGADGRFQGWRGRLTYLKRPVCVMDVLVLSATAIVVLWEERGSMVFADAHDHWAVEKLRFLQILRLFHIDRQMATWRLVKKMVKRSWFELLSAYYITFMVFSLLAVLVYTIENEWGGGIGWGASSSATSAHNSSVGSTPTFQNFGESFWFSIITVLTIGYGDKVPKRWQSKLVVSVLSYFGLSMFATASGLVGVGMSLMLHDQNKQRRRGKVRQLAARLLQAWYRYHLINDERKFHRIAYFRKCSAKLQLVEERFRRARLAARRTEERRAISAAVRKKTSIRVMLGRQASLMAPSLFNSPSTPPVSNGQSPISDSIISASLLRSGLPALIRVQQQQQMQTGGSAQNGSVLAAADSAGEDDPLAQLTFSSAFAAIPVEQRSHSNSQRSGDSQQTVKSASGVVIDESRMGHYRAILRLAYYLVFVINRRNFNRARKPYEMMDAESELCEMEHQRAQRFKDLELRLTEQLSDPLEEGPLNLHQRLNDCEEKLRRTESKLEQMLQLAEALLENFSGGEASRDPSLWGDDSDMPTTTEGISNHPGAELPPVPPNARQRHRGHQLLSVRWKRHRFDHPKHVPTLKRVHLE